MDEQLPKKILVADDDPFNLESLVDLLVYEGYRVITARSGHETLEVAKNHGGKFDLVILDIKMPLDADGDDDPTVGLHTGLRVARKLKKRYRFMKLIGLSATPRDSAVAEWFTEFGNGYVDRTMSSIKTLDTIHLAIYDQPRRPLKAFIVHGHDEELLEELRAYLAKDSLFDEPIILRDQPNLGRTIIEKFEDETSDVDLAFVLLTPDDVAYSKRAPDSERRRSRQNVVFELGYFHGKFQRTQGRAVILYKGALELPSDISGIVYIDVSEGGIASVSDEIQREAKAILAISAGKYSPNPW